MWFKNYTYTKYTFFSLYKKQNKVTLSNLKSAQYTVFICQKRKRKTMGNSMGNNEKQKQLNTCKELQAKNMKKKTILTNYQNSN